MPAKISRPVKPSTHNESKASTARIKYSLRPASQAVYNVSRKDCPDKRDKNGRVVPDVTAEVRGAFVCKGRRGVGKGRALLAARTLLPGDIFTCKRTRVYLRRTEDEGDHYAVQ